MTWDWNDLEGWNRYYRSYPAAGTPKIGQAEVGVLAEFCNQLPDLHSQGVRRIWFPGCGVSVMPGILAACGFEVWASDASQEAIALLQSWPSVDVWVPPMLARFAPRLHAQSPYRPGTLHLSLHDFRTPFAPNGDAGILDRIFNVQAFHGLAADDMDAAARVHWEALKPDGIAYFHTWKLERAVREQMESSLGRTGFVLPYCAEEAWLRAALDAEGIDYVFRGGEPKIHSLESWEERERQEQILARLLREYGALIEKKEAKTGEIPAEKVSKIARIVNSTG